LNSPSCDAAQWRERAMLLGILAPIGAEGTANTWVTPTCTV
jgi:hypothetical protein